MLHIYRIPGVTATSAVAKASNLIKKIQSIETEFCFNIEVSENSSLSEDQKQKLLWILTETFEPGNVAEEKSFLHTQNDKETGKHQYLVEVGPRMAFSTAWSSNCISMCQACGIDCLNRVERSHRYLVTTSDTLTTDEVTTFLSLIHDRMTECVYPNPLQSFANGANAEPVRIVPLLDEGKVALEKLNKEKGLGFDEWDIEFYTKMFVETLQRNPTDVECFDLGQSNSEHSRHWFFNGKIIIDEKEQELTLFQMVKATLPVTSNSIIAFHDNSSAIRGFTVDTLTPSDPRKASSMRRQRLYLHPILTAETHNFPSGVAPFPGAETGTGGRLRDVQATGRGAHSVAGISSYCVGNLLIPSHPLPWEDTTALYPSNLATPLQIEIDASNGASDYGNKYGEPVVAGFTRSYGQRVPSRERYEWIKPIMFTAGIGMMDDRHQQKGSPEEGMIVCKVGGPAYRIGMGGGAASSRVQGTAEAELDFSAVQRGDAEMENRMNRVIRGCIELGEANPIVSIHDQGAGGNGNVLKEIVDPLGAHFEIRDIPSGDPTLSIVELWGAEYQENNAILVRPEGLAIVQALGEREHCAVTPVGVVTSTGRVVVHDKVTNTTPFDLPLSLVLGKMPQKTFAFQTIPPTLIPLSLPTELTIMNALDRVLRLLDVGSKRFLTNKVDRSVTGLIAQQQCVGSLQIPLSNVAVIAQSHFTTRGIAVAVGEQPIKGLISPAAQARMTVAEGLSNLVFAQITSLADVKASGNWMWAAKLPGEGVKMYEACQALRDILLALGPSIDGGKDSLSMAAKVHGETVKSPGELTFTCYAACPDITKTITPDLRYVTRKSVLYYIDLGNGKTRLGGTALATVFNQVGNETPDVENVSQFKACFECIQTCIDQRLLGAGHDRSDGGLIVTLLEMAFAGNCGIHIHTMHNSKNNPIEVFFTEELGFVLEVLPVFSKSVESIFTAQNVPIHKIGYTTPEPVIHIEYNQQVILHETTLTLQKIWESTSFALERLQCHPDCVTQEEISLNTRKCPPYQVTYPLKATPSAYLEKPLSSKPCIAVIRQEGSNGDREMLSAFYAVGFDAWDVNMHDIVTKTITIDRFQGVIFCGGFSYADVNDSAKGWASVIQFNPHVLAQFDTFRKEEHTFSLGICNGCQLMALLGWVPFATTNNQQQQGVVLSNDDKSSNNESFMISSTEQPRFIHNTSGRFESRWSTVTILPSPAVLLQGMEGSTLGVWVAHGEGKAYFPNRKHLDLVQSNHLAPLRYVNDENEVTEAYPFNPNGSPHGIAGLCSLDGRHLALMPHPERCFVKWQLPYLTNEMRESYPVAPWLRFFQNAYEFVIRQQQQS